MLKVVIRFTRVQTLAHTTHCSLMLCFGISGARRREGIENRCCREAARGSLSPDSPYHCLISLRSVTWLTLSLSHIITVCHLAHLITVSYHYTPSPDSPYHRLISLHFVTWLTLSLYPINTLCHLAHRIAVSYHYTRSP